MAGFADRAKLRDMTLSDVPRFVRYWYRSSDSFLRGMGVDPRRMKPESEFEQRLKEQIQQNLGTATSKLALLTIDLDGEAVGSHSLGDLVEGASAVFHAHVWEPEARGIGLCTYTYPLAAQIFMDRFGLNELIFKTPSLNTGANRIKQKLGIECIGEEPISYSFMLPGLTAKVYRLTRPALAALIGS
jgi:hypothetical protein